MEATRDYFQNICINIHKITFEDNSISNSASGTFRHDRRVLNHSQVIKSVLQSTLSESSPYSEVLHSVQVYVFTRRVMTTCVCACVCVV